MSITHTSKAYRTVEANQLISVLESEFSFDQSSYQSLSARNRTDTTQVMKFLAIFLTVYVAIDYIVLVDAFIGFFPGSIFVREDFTFEIYTVTPIFVLTLRVKNKISKEVIFIQSQYRYPQLLILIPFCFLEECRSKIKMSLKKLH